MTLSGMEAKPTLYPADNVMNDITERTTSPVDCTFDTTKCQVVNHDTGIQGASFNFIWLYFFPEIKMKLAHSDLKSSY